MIDYLSMPFVQMAVVASLFASILCGIVGTLIVVRRVALIAGSISHAAFGGIGLGFWLGLPPFTVALFFSGLLGIAMGVFKDKLLNREDTALSALWAAGMALGILLIFQTEGYAADLIGYLFGSLLLVEFNDVALLAGMAGVATITICVFYRTFQALTFDDPFSRISNIPITALNIVFYTLVSLSVVVLIKVVGVILVLALITLPAASVERYSRTLRGMMVGASALAFLECLAGLALAIGINRPAGPVIILLSFSLYVISQMAMSLKR
ncbi:MAG: metal ABC transporter permease [bacterium]|nr:metal ABC transporter permease [bacterium]